MDSKGAAMKTNPHLAEIALFLVGLILGGALCYALIDAQIDHEHEWDVKCYFPPARTINSTSASFPITCYSPFFSEKTTINITLVEVSQ
jgi:hypothetical protein